MERVRRGHVDNDTIGFPFTLRYARETTPREVWSEPLFHRVHLRLTTVRGVIFTLDAALAMVALGGSYVRMLSVNIPGASMIFGFIFSRIYRARYRSRFSPPAGQRFRCGLRGKKRGIMANQHVRGNWMAISLSRQAEKLFRA